VALDVTSGHESAGRSVKGHSWDPLSAPPNFDKDRSFPPEFTQLRHPTPLLEPMAA